jgi:hypothetical protein
MNLPTTIYVKAEQDGNEHFFVSHEDIECHAEMGEKVRVGVYQLVEVLSVETVVQSRVAK